MDSISFDTEIGGLNNQASAIGRRGAAQDPVSRDTPQILNPVQLRKFRVQYESDGDEGSILVYKNEDHEPFMTYQDPSPLHIRAVGFRTGSESGGYWEFMANALFTGNMAFRTDTEYYYRYDLPLVSSEQVEEFEFYFLAQANNDVHIALAPQHGLNDDEPLYEIVIGGWSNTRSVIRRCKQCGNLVNVDSVPLNADEFRLFRITYNRGHIGVYSGPSGDDLMMEWTDDDPLPIGAVGYSTGWNSPGRFVFQSFDLY